MTMFRPLLAAALAAGLLTGPALAQRPRDQDQAFRATTEGRGGARQGKQGTIQAHGNHFLSPGLGATH